MARYLRLYACFLRFSFSKALQFRLDFCFRIVMDALWYAVNLAFFSVLYQHTSLLGGWTYDQVLVFASALFVADGLHMTVFSNNMWWLPISVNRGDLDYYLVRPVSSLYFLSLREFAANSFLNLLLAIGIFVWALARYPASPGVLATVGFVLLLGLGVFIHYALHVIFLVPVFWLHGTTGMREVFYSVDRFRDRPHGIYTAWFRRILTSVLPLALVASVPTQAFFDGLGLRVVLHMLAVAAAVFLVLLWLWRRGLRAYASASS